MLNIKDYMNRLEDEKARLADLADTTGVTAQMVVDALTPEERKIVDMLGGETMIYALFNGNVDTFGKLVIEPDVENDGCGSDE